MDVEATTSKEFAFWPSSNSFPFSLQNMSHTTPKKGYLRWTGTLSLPLPIFHKTPKGKKPEHSQWSRVAGIPVCGRIWWCRRHWACACLRGRFQHMKLRVMRIRKFHNVKSAHRRKLYHLRPTDSFLSFSLFLDLSGAWQLLYQSEVLWKSASEVNYRIIRRSKETTLEVMWYLVISNEHRQ